MPSQVGPLVTIPGCIATHVLGGASVDLADGDLTLVSTTSIRSSTSETPDKKPFLTLTVGKAAFPLYKDTIFGTLESDERVYIFQPDLGEEIKGYVRVNLPEGVIHEGSEFWSLQEQFEKVLISHGLLQAKAGGDESKARSGS